MAEQSTSGDFPAYDEAFEEPKPFPWGNLVVSIVKRWKFIVGSALGASILALGITFFFTPLYKAETSILPELAKERSLGLAGFASLAEATGLNVGETPVSKLYPIMVHSERVLKPVLFTNYRTRSNQRPVTLMEYWGIENDAQNQGFERALKKLRGRITVNFDMRLGTVGLAVEMEEPQLAADVANQITTQLDDYTRTKRRTNATLQREFIEQRMHEVEGELEKTENLLREFRERNRRIADSPQLLLDHERLSREVQIHSTIFIELKKQLEIAKIEEIKNIPLINVLDHARPPARKSFPRRGDTMVVIFALTLATALTFSALDEKLRMFREYVSELIRSEKGKRVHADDAED